MSAGFYKELLKTNSDVAVQKAKFIEVRHMSRNGFKNLAAFSLSQVEKLESFATSTSS